MGGPSKLRFHETRHKLHAYALCEMIPYTAKWVEHPPVSKVKGGHHTAVGDNQEVPDKPEERVVHGISVDRGGMLKLWCTGPMAGPKRMEAWRLHGHYQCGQEGSRVTAMCLSPEEDVVAVGLHGGSVEVIGLRVKALAAAPRGQSRAASHKLTATFTKLFREKMHAESITAMAMRRDALQESMREEGGAILLVTGSLDRTVRVGKLYGDVCEPVMCFQLRERVTHMSLMTTSVAEAEHLRGEYILPNGSPPTHIQEEEEEEEEINEESPVLPPPTEDESPSQKEDGSMYHGGREILTALVCHTIYGH